MSTHRERSRAAAEVKLDAVAKRIVELLQEDGRRSYADIAKEVSLSEAAVRQRMARLVESGVMQIVAVTNPMQLGFTREAMVGVKVNGPVAPVAERLGELAEADYVVITAGTFDILVEVVCEHDDHLRELLDEMRQIHGVASTETMLYLKLHKQHYNWGTR